jgi:hypothetical protein
MDGQGTFSEKVHGYTILEYLTSIKNSSNEENIDVAVQCIANALNLDMTSANDFAENSYFPVSCSDLITAGATSTGAMTYATALEAANKDPKFRVFADTCAKKGYFNGVEEGSVEYLQRNAKLIKKFREKTTAATAATATTAATTTTPAAGKDAEAAAEEKKLAGNEVRH